MIKVSDRFGRRLAFVAAGGPLFAMAAISPANSAPPAKLQYNRDIRPILAENCFACHGPDSAARKAGLRLDRFVDAAAKVNGHSSFVPGKPLLSEALKRMMGLGPTMPPPATKKHVTPEQIQLIRRWISEGAEYEKHWSYIAPVKALLPTVKNRSWVRNPIDNFVMSNLEKVGLQPAPEADRRTIARRLSLDITGLPPDPADVERFAADLSSNAYEKLIDKFLASPQYGEHRARYWLDAARYGDTHGIHMDFYREMYSYRDWVIKAFNQNKPFDVFTIEQIAGDLLPNPSLDQRIATGFNRCNITSNEGGAIDEEYIVLYARDRTETTSTVFLGSTLGCCVCHDHKFDPFTAKDFYSMSAFFNNTTQRAMDGNIKDTPPTIAVPMEIDRERLDKLPSEIAVAKKSVADIRTAKVPEFDKAASSGSILPSAAIADIAGARFHAPLTEGAGRNITVTLNSQPVSLLANADPDWTTGSISSKAFVRKAGSSVESAVVGDFDKDQMFTVSAWIKIANANTTGAIAARMDDLHDYRGWDFWIENGGIGSHMINKWPENGLKVVSNDKVKPGEWHHVALVYHGKANPESMKVFIDGSERATSVQNNTLTQTMRTSVPFKIGQRNTSAGIDGVGIQDLRIYDRLLSQSEIKSLGAGMRNAWLAKLGPSKWSPQERESLFAGWLNETDKDFGTTAQNLAKLEQEDREIRMRGTVAHVMNERTETPAAYVLFRGDYDKRRDKVGVATPAVLPPLPDGYPKNRLGIAKWLVLPENPLTARVTVNRFWQEIFETGLVKSAGDFGVSGEIPVNQALLDWLAVDFREHSWDVKRFLKQIYLSATYRQSGMVTANKKLKDPMNRLCSRGPRFRMDGEMVRDYALAASGTLVKKIGGPSVRPYQPDGVWEAVTMIGSDTRDYKRDSGDKLYRRSLYTFWKRTAPPASLEIFNAPTREVCTVRRDRTNTPLQALVTLNDIQFVEAARNLAQLALKEGGSTNGSRIDFVARRLLSRPLNSAEIAIVNKSLTGLQSYYSGRQKEAMALISEGESKPDANLKPEQLAAWTMVANQMMNLDEVLNK